MSLLSKKQFILIFRVFSRDLLDKWLLKNYFCPTCSSSFSIKFIWHSGQLWLGISVFIYAIKFHSLPLNSKFFFWFFPIRQGSSYSENYWWWDSVWPVNVLMGLIDHEKVALFHTNLRFRAKVGKLDLKNHVLKAQLSISKLSQWF